MEPDEIFIEAVKNGDTGLVRALLQKNSSFAGCKAPNGQSAVMLAWYNGHKEIVRLLLEQGINIDIFEAAALGYMLRVSRLLAHAPETLNAFGPDGFTPLGLAAFFGHTELVVNLLNWGANPNLASDNDLGAAPLHSAVASRQVEIAGLLLARGADVNARYQNGYTALHAAAENGQVAMVQLLLEHGAQPFAAKDDGLTPLMLAEMQGFQQVAEMIRSAAAQTQYL
jgi:ankyrin repeat protein